MLKLIQYLKGYVVIKVWGFSPERFMNLCSNHHIFLWGIINHCDYYTMCISIKDFYKLKSITRKTGTRVVIQKRCGLPFFVPKIKRRKVFIAGLIGSLIFWIWMSGYIWAIELQGNYYVTNDVLIGFMNDNDIKIGMKKSAVNIESLEKSLRKQYDIITWTSAKIDGTRLIVQIKENDLLEAETREEYDEEENTGYDLIAEKEGTIVSIITRSGMPLVSEGSQVMAGDILVEGGLPIYNDDLTVKKYQFCRSDADIYIKCYYDMQERIPIAYEEKQYSEKEKKIPIIILFGKKIKLQFFRNNYKMYDVVEDTKQIKLLENYYLPIYYGSEYVREYDLIAKSYDKEEAKGIFSAKLTKNMQTLVEKGVQIIEKDVTISKDNKNWYVNARLEVIEKTGKLVPTKLSQIEVREENVPETE